MFDPMEKSITFSFPSGGEYESVGVDNKNYSFMISTSDFNSLPFDEVISSETDPKYEQFLADIWVGIILTLIVLSCVCCMCSCLLYHKFQQWKISLLQSRNEVNIENGTPECESLPSYSIASGLPSYSEALEQLKKVKELSVINTKQIIENEEDPWVPRTPPTPVARLSVTEFLQLYKNANHSFPSKLSS